jgi:hypothetical protein
VRARTATARLVAIVAIALALPAAGAQSSGESATPLVRGTKVRVELRDGSMYEGRVVTFEHDTLVTEHDPPSELTTPLRQIARLERANGRHRPIAQGAIVGALTGGALGAILGARSFSDDGDDLVIGSRGAAAALGGVLLGVPGLVIGTVVGLIPRDRWERVPLEPRVVRLDLRALPHGAHGVGLAIAF